VAALQRAAVPMTASTMTFRSKKDCSAAQQRRLRAPFLVGVSQTEARAIDILEYA
jgi:hypothetical protein